MIQISFDYLNPNKVDKDRELPAMKNNEINL